MYVFGRKRTVPVGKPRRATQAWGKYISAYIVPLIGVDSRLLIIFNNQQRSSSYKKTHSPSRKIAKYALFLLGNFYANVSSLPKILPSDLSLFTYLSQPNITESSIVLIQSLLVSSHHVQGTEDCSCAPFFSSV